MAKKVILISGGTSGLGKALALALAPDHTVVAFGLNASASCAELRAVGVQCVELDIRSSDNIDAIVSQTLETHGRIDVLINSAGVLYQGFIEDHTVEDIRNTLETNTLGTILLSRAVVPQMKAQGSGRIININSRGGLYPLEQRSAYIASKWAITGFSEVLRRELAPFGVGVTILFPGRMNTPLFAQQGIETDLRNALDPAIVAAHLKTVIEAPNNLAFPEVGIEQLPATASETSVPDIEFSAARRE